MDKKNLTFTLILINLKLTSKIPELHNEEDCHIMTVLTQIKNNKITKGKFRFRETGLFS